MLPAWVKRERAGVLPEHISHKPLPIRICMPWNNLGCLGIWIGQHIYMDFFTRPYFGFFFCNKKGYRFTIPLSPRAWRRRDPVRRGLWVSW